MSEEWRPVVGYEGSYEVSDLGRVRSLDRTLLCSGAQKGSYVRRFPGRLLRPGVASNRYHTVALGRGNTRTIHSLVADAFLGVRPEGSEVLHRDGNRLNSTLRNLIYGTRSENNKQIVYDGKRLLSIKDISGIRRRIRNGEVLTRIAEDYGVSLPHVSAIKHGRYYSHV